MAEPPYVHYLRKPWGTLMKSLMSISQRRTLSAAKGKDGHCHCHHHGRHGHHHRHHHPQEAHWGTRIEIIPFAIFFPLHLTFQAVVSCVFICAVYVVPGCAPTNATFEIL